MSLLCSKQKEHRETMATVCINTTTLMCKQVKLICIDKRSAKTHAQRMNWRRASRRQSKPNHNIQTYLRSLPYLAVVWALLPSSSYLAIAHALPPWWLWCLSAALALASSHRPRCHRSACVLLVPDPAALEMDLAPSGVESGRKRVRKSVVLPKMVRECTAGSTRTEVYLITVIICNETSGV